MKTSGLLLLITIFYSCVNTKKTGSVWIKGNQELFERTNGVGSIKDPKDHIRSFHLEKGIKGRVTIPSTTSEVLRIKFLSDTSRLLSTTNSREASSDPKVSGFYFPGKIEVPKDLSNDCDFRGPKFKYVEIKQAVQTLTIPLKLRPERRDTIKSTASASVNLGFAYVFKFTNHTYRRLYWNNSKKAEALADQNNKFTYAFGPFIGPTIVDLKSGNTDGKVTKDRSVIGLTYGGVAVLGYNEFNVGLALGFDTALGGEGKHWIYKNKPWIGFVLALDIIK